MFRQKLKPEIVKDIKPVTLFCRFHRPKAYKHNDVSIFISPIKNSGKDQSTERYEKQTSSNRQLLERAQANSWEQAADLAFPSQSGKPADAEHRRVQGSAVLLYQKSEFPSQIE
ncbi:hypothetical protein EB796_001156 [Bugula neritina]|uniref:Uncharacterized protein n=1 Tax=Bugula neritina TaxID=10212 RepID=A0A7J7KQT0_BUGNE|nr:hypothetical protein EB796_001156 [Bugula neritina]